MRKASDETAQHKQAEAAKSARSLEEERRKAAALAQEAARTKRAGREHGEHRQALEEERARSAALASELATAQREIEAQAAQLRQAEQGNRAAQAGDGKRNDGTATIICSTERDGTEAMARESRVRAAHGRCARHV